MVFFGLWCYTSESHVLVAIRPEWCHNKSEARHSRVRSLGVLVQLSIFQEWERVTRGGSGGGSDGSRTLGGKDRVADGAEHVVVAPQHHGCFRELVLVLILRTDSSRTAEIKSTKAGISAVVAFRSAAWQLRRRDFTTTRAFSSTQSRVFLLRMISSVMRAMFSLANTLRWRNS